MSFWQSLSLLRLEPRWLGLLAITMVLGVVGCKKNAADAAFDPDANGYLCPSCNAKFYTDRSVFPTRCPQCKQPKVDTVLGFVCPSDQHTTLAVRGPGAAKCEQCGQSVSAIRMPAEAEFRAWGAVKKSREDVGG